MNIMFITLIDIKTINEEGIYQDLIREFIKNGHKLWLISPQETNNKQLVTHEDNCTIVKVKTGVIQKTNIIKKGINTIIIDYKFRNAVKNINTDSTIDLVIYTTPPITIVKTIKYLVDKYNSKTYLLLKDIFPQNAVDLGILKSFSLLYYYFRKTEKKLYKMSDYIGCMSEANVKYLIKHNNYLSQEIIHISPNSIEVKKYIINDTSRIRTREKYNIPVEKTIFIYGGNLGKPQDIDFLIECLNSNENKNDSFFIICGKGTEYIKLEKYVLEYNPMNVMLIPGLPKQEYDSLLSACDIGLIFLSNKFTIPNFPSRILSYMEKSLPVIACTDKNTDIGDVITKGGFGWWCESNSSEGFKKIVDDACLLDLSQMKIKSREYLLAHYTSLTSYNIIIRKIDQNTYSENEI